MSSALLGFYEHQTPIPIPRLVPMRVTHQLTAWCPDWNISRHQKVVPSEKVLGSVGFEGN